MMFVRNEFLIHSIRQDTLGAEPSVSTLVNVQILLKVIQQRTFGRAIAQTQIETGQRNWRYDFLHALQRPASVSSVLQTERGI